MKVCLIEGCGGIQKSRGYCNKHYQALRNHGNPLGGRPHLPPRNDGLKVCTKCKVPKDPKCFHSNITSKDGLSHYCKPCNKRSPYEGRKDRLLRRFGLTLEDYDILLMAQGGVCAICGKPETTKSKNLSVDHCHTTKKVRGLLCDGCNKGIGCLKDSIPNLSAAIEYLKRSDGGAQ